ncbi:MAG: type II toxin-antitoxin system PemK/MazF family toxin [Desulfobacterales bacterium]
MNIRRGEIYLAALDPTIGREISKTRPVVVVSNNINNQFSGTVTILPITSKNLRKIYPFELLLAKGTGKLPKNSKVKADQIRTIDRNRVVKYIGELPKEEMNSISKAIKIHLDLEQT